MRAEGGGLPPPKQPAVYPIVRLSGDGFLSIPKRNHGTVWRAGGRDSARDGLPWLRAAPPKVTTNFPFRIGWNGARYAEIRARERGGPEQ